MSGGVWGVSGGVWGGVLDTFLDLGTLYLPPCIQESRTPEQIGLMATLATAQTELS